MLPLAEALMEAAQSVRNCRICHSLDSSEICGICRDPARDRGLICVVAQIGDVWAIERGGAYRGLYHVLGGTLSALDGMGPEQLSIGSLLTRIKSPESKGLGEVGGDGEIVQPPQKLREIILALNATVEGQTTAHYLTDIIQDAQGREVPGSGGYSGSSGQPLKITRLAQGLPMGGELDYLDDGTLAAALHSRRAVE